MINKNTLNIFMKFLKFIVIKYVYVNASYQNILNIYEYYKGNIVLN